MDVEPGVEVNAEVGVATEVSVGDAGTGDVGIGSVGVCASEPGAFGEVGSPVAK